MDIAFVQVPLLIVSIFFVRGVFLYFGEYLATKSGANVIRDLRAELYGTVTHQSFAFFRLHSTGVILARILNDVQRLQRVSTKMLADLVRSQERMGELAGRLTESIGGIRVVQSFGMEAFEGGRFRTVLDRMLRADLRAGRAAALSPALMELLEPIQESACDSSVVG